MRTTFHNIFVFLACLGGALPAPLLAALLVSLMLSSAHAMDFPRVPNDARIEYQELLPSAELIQKVDAPDLYTGDQRNQAVQAWVRAVSPSIPALTQSEIEHFAIVSSRISTAPGISTGFYRNGGPLLGGRNADGWKLELMTYWVKSTDADDEFVRRWVAVMPSNIDLLKERFNSLTFREQFEWARKAHEAGCKTREFRDWARVIKAAAEREAQEPDIFD